MILVTGASGFIGKHLLGVLSSLYGKENIVALSSAPIEGYKYLLHSNYSFADDFFLASECDSIDTIVHVGAFTPKSGNQANDIEGCYANISNTKKLLDARLPALKRFIFLSTLDVYGNADVITEQTAIEPASLYGLSKVYCERMVEVFGQKKSITVQILRVGHVYGPGEEHYQKIIPVTFRKLLQKQPIQLWGSGEEKRAFIFIADIVKAIAASLELKEYIGPINLVGIQALTIRELLDLMIKITGVSATIQKVPSTVTSRNFVFDNSKMKNFLLKSETPLLQGLSEEWEYMRHIPQ